MASLASDRPPKRWKGDALAVHRRSVLIPRQDWTRLRYGVKTEVRIIRLKELTIGSLEAPAPVLGYSYDPATHEREEFLFVLETVREDMLGAIDEAGIRAEGYETLAEFRGYWKRRHMERGYRPDEDVWVLKLRPFTEDDIEPMALAAFERIYGPWLP